MNLRRVSGGCGHEPHGWRRLHPAIAGLFLLLAATLPGHADDASPHDPAASPDQIHRQIDQVERDPEIQKERPVAEAPPTLPSFRIHFPPWLPYAVLGAAGLGLLILITRLLVRYRRPQPDVAAEPVLVAAAGTAIQPSLKEDDHTFDEVDALANTGAFAEAIHRLLLLVQARLRPRLESGMQPSLTSREILRRARLPAEASTALSRLVGAVELTLFGMHSANAAIYMSCREDCRQVLAASA